MRTASTTPRRGPPGQRLMRQLHLWIGAWGALAAVLYGITGLMMNHRMGDNAWPQGSSTPISTQTLLVPADARSSAEALSLWLARTQMLEAQSIRKPPADARGARARVTLSGGSAAQSWSVAWSAGSAEAELTRTRHNALAAFNRLHKTVGGGSAWVLLADSFAIAMTLLGLSGLWLWLRGRDWRQALLSVFAASVLVLAAVLGPALFG